VVNVVLIIVQKLQKQWIIYLKTTHDEIDENFSRVSNQTIQRTRDTVNNLIAEIHEREKAIIKDIENGLEIRKKEREKRTE
jgi:hypothetical protein